MKSSTNKKELKGTTGFVQFTWAIRKEDYVKLLRVFGEINILIIKKENIPYKLVKEISSYLKSPDDYELLFNSNRATKLLNSFWETLNKQLGEEIMKKLSLRAEKTHLYFYDNLHYSLQKFFELINSNKELSKNETLLHFFNHIQQWKTKATALQKKILSKYYHVIISGLLTQLVGYKLSQKNTSTNSAIFQACRYPLTNALKRAYPNS